MTDAPAADDLPLKGLRVLDVSSWIAAPAAAVVLGDYGADVIKVEPPGDGDPHRHNIHLSHIPKAGSTNYLWHLDARGKRSIALDLKVPEAREALDRLIATADILITNYPFPVRARLKLAWHDVKAINERLIYASFTGYGEQGPDKDQPGFDSNAYFARSGIFDSARYDGQPPSFSLPAQGDRASAMGLLSGILMALYRRERTGKGGMVSSSLFANGLWSNGIMAQAALLGSTIGPRPPRTKPRSALANIYQSRDGRWIQVTAVLEDKLWPSVCKAIDRPSLEHDPRFTSATPRRANSEALTSILDEAFRQRDWEEWRDILLAHKIPHAPIQRALDVQHDAQAAAAEIVVDTKIAEMPRTLAAPFRIDGVQPRMATEGPTLGAQTDDILAEAGYSPSQIKALRDVGGAA